VHDLEREEVLKVGMDSFRTLSARTYKLSKELAIDVLDRIQSESICPSRLYHSSSQEKASDQTYH